MFAETAIRTGWGFAEVWKPVHWVIVERYPNPQNLVVFTGWHTAHRLVELEKSQTIILSTSKSQYMRCTLSIITTYLQQSAYFFFLGCGERYGGRHPILESNTDSSCFTIDR